MYLSFRVFSQNESESLTSPDFKQLEDSIKKILENVNTSGAAATSAPPASGIKIPEGASDNVIIQELQTQLERFQLQVAQKDQELTQVKEELTNVKGATSEGGAGQPAAAAAVDTTQYEDKIKDLEARLNEYSIIEDDIADLSFYKEETVRLQNEVDKLKAQLESSGVPVADKASASASANKEGAKPPKLESVKPTPEPEKSKTVEPTTGANKTPKNTEVTASSDGGQVSIGSSVKASEESKPADDSDYIDNDIMAEFERAVAEQKASAVSSTINKSTKSVVTPSSEVSAPQASDPQANIDALLAANGTPANNEKIKLNSEAKSINLSTEKSDTSAGMTQASIDQISNELVKADKNIIPTEEESAAVEKNEPQSEPLVEVNMDKMLSEAEDLTQIANNNSVDTQNSINETLDTDKLLQEASGMNEDESQNFKELKKQGA